MKKQVILLLLVMMLSNLSQANAVELPSSSIYPGIYSLVIHPKVDSQNITVTVDVNAKGINKSSSFYNSTFFEELTDLKVSILEAGLSQTKVINEIMISNTNASLDQPAYPIYSINTSSITRDFLFYNTLDAKSYTLQAIATFNVWALSGLAISEFSKQIVNTTILTMTGQQTNTSSSNSKTADFFMVSLVALPILALIKKRHKK